MNIGIDIMGGDFAPSETIKGVGLALDKLQSDTHFTLFGDKAVLESAFPEPNPRVTLRFTSQVIPMGEHATRAVVQFPDSSIVKGFEALKRGEIDAYASAGNTGAMLVGGMYSVKTIPGVIRPCIASMVPKEKGGYGLLRDVGANADCRADVLMQFGILGSIYASSVLSINQPKVGLINIGEEEEKGSLLAQAAHKMLKDLPSINFIGNIEGRDLFNELADVMVTDGFTGNVMLKMAESFYVLVKKRRISDAFFDLFNYEDYGGSPILGLNKPVVIGHGISNGIAICNMLRHAESLCRTQVTENIKQAFS